MTGWARKATCDSTCCQLCAVEWGSIPLCIKSHYLIECDISLPSVTQSGRACTCDDCWDCGDDDNTCYTATIPAVNGYCMGGTADPMGNWPCRIYSALSAGGEYWEMLAGGYNPCGGFKECCSGDLDIYINDAWGAPLPRYSCEDDSVHDYLEGHIEHLGFGCTLELLSGIHWRIKVIATFDSVCNPALSRYYYWSWTFDAACIQDELDILNDADNLDYEGFFGVSGGDNYSATVETGDQWNVACGYADGTGLTAYPNHAMQYLMVEDFEPSALTIRVPDYGSVDYSTDGSGYGSSLCEDCGCSNDCQHC